VSNKGVNKNVPKSKENDLIPTKAEELRRVVKAAQANYGKYPNVIGIGAGKKSKGGNWTDELSIHFFCFKKKYRAKISKVGEVPIFVYGRFEDGRANRKKRYETDVIEAGNIKLTCCAGNHDIWSWHKRNYYVAVS